MRSLHGLLFIGDGFLFPEFLLLNLHLENMVQLFKTRKFFYWTYRPRNKKIENGKRRFKDISTYHTIWTIEACDILH